MKRMLATRFPHVTILSHIRTIRRGALRLLMIGALLSSVAYAQGNILLGPVAGYEFGFPLAITSDPGTVNTYQFEGDGSAFNHTLLFGGYIGFPAIFGNEQGIVGRMALSLGFGEYTSREFTGDRVVDPLTDLIVPSTYQLHLFARTTTLHADIRWRKGFDTSFAMEFGGWLGARLQGKYSKTLKRVAPVIPDYFGDGDSALIGEGDGLASAPIHAGAVLSGSYRIPIARGITLEPELYTRVDIAALADPLPYRALSAGATVALLFDIGGASEPIPSPPIVEAERDTARVSPPVDTASVLGGNRPADTARIPRFAARIDLMGHDRAGGVVQRATIRPEMVAQRSQIPFPAMIYFERNSPALPPRFIRLTPDGADRYSTDSLVRLAPAEMYRHALCLLGLRMRQNPEGKVVLSGSRSAEEPEDLAMARAEKVREYLLEIWGIAGERVAVRSEGIPAGNGADGDICCGVRITSPSGEILAPVTIDWRARSYALPTLDIQPEIEAEAGVRFWGVTVRQGKKVITNYSSNGDEGTGDEVTFHIPDDFTDTILPPLVAELVVEDSTGRRIAATDTLPLSLLRDTSAGNVPSPAWERSVYILDAAGDGPGDLRAIAASIRDGDRLIVADAAGRHSRRIADLLRDLVKPRRTTIDIRREAIIAETSREHTPEERALAGGVKITVERGGK